MADPYTENSASTLKDKVFDAASQAKDKVQEMGRGVQGKIDQSRAPAADKLQNAALALHDRADRLPGGERVAGIAHTAADKMHATAGYVRDHNVDDMMADVGSFVKRYPGQSLLAAAAVGFLVGRAFRSED